MTFLGFLYLQQVARTASQGADVQGLEERMLDLKEKQRELELEGAQLRSIQNVEDRVKELNLVEANSVAYLAPVDDRVALSNE